MRVRRVHGQLTVIPQWSVAGPGQLVIPVEVKIGTQDSSCAATVVTDSESCWDDAASQLIDGTHTTTVPSQLADFKQELMGVLANFKELFNGV